VSAKSLDVFCRVFCPSVLVDNCKELQEIFHCNDSYSTHHIKIVDVAENGYLIRFEKKETRSRDDGINAAARSTEIVPSYVR